MSKKDQIPYLGVKDVAEIIGLQVRQVRNIAPHIPGAFQNSSGWQIPRSGIEWIKNRPETRGRKPKKRGK
jgi:hypothetical protein